MKAYSYLLTVLSICAVAVACQSEESTKDQGPAKAISFKAALGKYEVKATDTAFEKGDVVGLFADAPVSASNVALTWDGEAVKPASTLYWGADQAGDQASAFYAYYPYSQSVTSTSFKFAVPADQSVEANYKAADLMLASALGTPDVGEVYLRFAHQLSRLVFEIDASSFNSTVASVQVEGLRLVADVDLTMPDVDVDVDANPAIIKAAPLVKADGTKAWGVIAPAQEAEGFCLKISLADGSEVAIERDWINLNAGVSYTGKVILDQTSVPMSFEFEVFDWINGGYFYLGKAGDPGTHEHIWAVEYNNDYIDMELLESGLYYAALTGSGWYEFRIVRRDLGTVWGQAVQNNLSVGQKEIETVIAPNNNYIYAQCQEGNIQMWLDPVRKVLTLKAVPREWEPLGTGKMVEAFVCEVYDLPHKEIEVEIMKDANSNSYRIVNPYKNWPYSEQFDYQDGEDIIINVKSNNRCYIEESPIGLFDPDTYEEMVVFSMVEENGWGRNYYGYFNPNYGYFAFYSTIGFALLGEDGSYGVNYKGMFSVTLPGYERPEYWYAMDLEMVEQKVDAEGHTWVDVNVYTGMDVTGLRYGLYAGSLSREEVYGTGGLWKEVQEKGTEIQNVPDGWVKISLPVAKTGSYTLVFDIDVNGKQHYDGNFFSNGFVIDGDEAPAVDASVKVELDPVYGEQNATVLFTFADPEEVYLLIMEEAEFQKAAVAEEDIYDFTLSNGWEMNKYVISPETGSSTTVSGLIPDTQYHVILAGTNNFGQIGWVETSFKTNPAPDFQSLGYGIFNDDWTGLERESVEIFKANTTPVRYKVADPYYYWWKGVDPGYYFAERWYFTGNYASEIDIYVDGEKVVYNSFYNGEALDDYGPVMFQCYSLLDGSFLENNKVLQEGVFNLAPHINLTWSRKFYNWSSAIGEIYIVLPGYEYTPAAAGADGAPALRSVNKGKPSSYSPLAPVQEIRPVTEVSPIKRHMLPTGNATVTAVEKTATTSLESLVINK